MNSMVNVLSDISGIEKSKIRKIAQDVKENHEKLNACSFHDFSICVNPEKTFDQRWKCVNCGGTVDAIRKKWYELGTGANYEPRSKRT